MPYPLIIFLAVLATQGHPHKRTTSSLFRDDKCGIRFTVPRGCTVSVDPEDAPCTFTLLPPPDRDIVMASPGTPDTPCHLGNIHLAVFRHSIETSALRADFTFEDERWHFMSGSSFDNVVRFKGNGWRGMRAKSASTYCGAAQEVHSIVLGHGSRSLTIGVHGNNVDLAERLMATLTLLK